MKFLPLGLAAEGVEDTRFGLTRLRGPIATRAVPILRRSRFGGLSLARFVKQFFGDDFADGDGELFEFGHASAPGWPLRSPDAVGELFGDVVEFGSEFVESVE